MRSADAEIEGTNDGLNALVENFEDAMREAGEPLQAENRLLSDLPKCHARLLNAKATSIPGPVRFQNLRLLGAVIKFSALCCGDCAMN